MKNRYLWGSIVTITIFSFVSFFYPVVSSAANLTVAKDTLQNSRMSFRGRVSPPTAGGSNHVWIYTAASGEATSVSTAGLKPGDSLVIGGTNTYVIASIIDNDEFTTVTNLDPGDANDEDVIYFKSRPQHVITFKTASAVNGGFFRVLIPAASSNSNDTIPDTSGFDFNSGVTATATDATGYTFVTGVATASGGSGCTSPANYHCFEFHYTGSGASNTDITLKVGETGGANTMIAPAPSTSRVANTADTYTFKVQNFTNAADPETATATDDVTGKIAVIESVRVTATVDPSLTFKIEGVADTVTACSLDLDVTTTNASVPFGVMALDTFKTGAQKLTVSTNGVTGYAVTAIENSQLSNLATSPSYIPDTTCDNNLCDHDTSDTWATEANNPGFGYTVEILSGTPTIAPTAPNYQHFPSLGDGETPFQIMSNASIASSQQAYVCYKLSVDATQPAGNYENQITYTATASF
ncbi:MAG TPA: hypothetical protein VLH94_01765 [Spirochaetia bacterium]|nr:hypothetical protein [Spirochaetia bacterium]